MVEVAGGLKPNCQGLGPPSANVVPLKLNRLVKKNKTFFTNNLPILTNKLKENITLSTKKIRIFIYINYIIIKMKNYEEYI